MPLKDEPRWTALAQAVARDAPPAAVAALARQFADHMDAVQSSAAPPWSALLAAAASQGQLEALSHVLQQQPQNMSTDDVCCAFTQALRAAASGGCPRADECFAALWAEAAAHGMADKLVMARDAQHRTLLMALVLSGRSALIPMLLAHCPQHQLTVTDSHGMTALMHAAQGGQTACIPLLLSHIPDVQLAANGKLTGTALEQAAVYGHVEVINSIMQQLSQHTIGADAVRQLLVKALFKAVKAGKKQCCRALLAAATAWKLEGAICLARDSMGHTPLATAAFSGRAAACITALLTVLPEQQVTARSTGGQTPLMKAAFYGSAAAVTALLSLMPGIQLSAVDDCGQTALHLAASVGQTHCVRLLLCHMPEAQLEAVDSFGQVPFLTAVWHQHAETAQALLEYSPEQQLAAVDDVGLSALDLATREASPEMVRLLLSYGPTAQPELDIALANILCLQPQPGTGCDTDTEAARRAACVRLLLSKGARLKDVGGPGVDQLWPILHEIANSGSRVLVEGLVGLAAEVSSLQAPRVSTAHSRQASGSRRSAKRLRTEPHNTVTGPAADVATAAHVTADLVQAATQCNIQRLQRLLSFRDTPQPHLDQALTAALTAEVAEAAKAERQRCVVLLLARGAKLDLQGQVDVDEEMMSALWLNAQGMAAMAYAGDSARQAVQGVR